MKSVLIFIIILLCCFMLRKYTLFAYENFNIDELSPGKPISNSQFSKMFEEIPLPASDELAEYGGRYQALEGIESPRMNLNIHKNNANTWIGVD